MAKKKDKDDSQGEVKTSDQTIDVSNFLIPLSALYEKQGRVFPTTISLDIALNGGIPEGSSILVSGKPKVGKTTLVLHYCGECQALDPNKEVFYFDVEGRLRMELINCFPKINKKRFNIIRSNESKILSAENYLNMIYQTLKDNPKCICILDSVASLCPEAEYSSNIGDSGRKASTATLMYSMFRKVSQILPVSLSTYIALTHMVANPMPGPGKKSFSVGGNAPQYGASVWLEAPWKEDIDDGGRSIGQIAHFNILSSALGAPGMQVAVPIIYGSGVDTARDIITQAISLGLIIKKGGWYEVEGIEKSIQGIENLITLFKSNLKMLEELDDKIRSMAIPNYESKITKKS